MSIHIKLSEEAEARMRTERRNAKIFSIFISGLFIAVIFLTLGLIALKSIDPEPDDFDVTYAPEKPDITEPKPPKPKSAVSNPRAPANHAMANRVLAVNTMGSISIPVVDNVNLSTDVVGISDVGFIGSGTDFTGAGGPGKDRFPEIVGIMSKRCSQEDRLNRLKEMGGRVEAEAAVEHGLEWLKANQNPDGSWSNKNISAMTGFSVLAYLGRCETPSSPKYGESCLKGIIYLVDLGMKNDGKLTTNASVKHWPYEHAIATYALCEALTFCDAAKHPVPNLSEVALKAVNLIIENQHSKSGGWDYGYDTKGNRGGDLSIAAWQVQALKAAAHTGLEIKDLKKAQTKAMEYVVNLQGDTGGFGYTGKVNGEAYAKLTGAGVLCLQMSGKKYSSEIRKGAKHILEFSKFDYDEKDSNLYSQYYESQAMMARGGSEWKKYNEMFRDQLINSQNPDGGWKAPGSGGLYNDAQYRNCLNILMLEVYYRFLPGTGSL